MDANTSVRQVFFGGDIALVSVAGFAVLGITSEMLFSLGFSLGNSTGRPIRMLSPVKITFISFTDSSFSEATSSTSKSVAQITSKSWTSELQNPLITHDPSEILPLLINLKLHHGFSSTYNTFCLFWRVDL